MVLPGSGDARGGQGQRDRGGPLGVSRRRFRATRVGDPIVAQSNAHPVHRRGQWRQHDVFTLAKLAHFRSFAIREIDDDGVSHGTENGDFTTAQSTFATIR